MAMNDNKYCPHCLVTYCKGRRNNLNFCGKCGTQLLTYKPRTIQEHRLLRVLQFNARAKVADLARMAGMKGSTVSDIMKRLDHNIIYVAVPKELQPQLQDLLAQKGSLYFNKNVRQVGGNGSP